MGRRLWRRLAPFGRRRLDPPGRNAPFLTSPRPLAAYALRSACCEWTVWDSLLFFRKGIAIIALSPGVAAFASSG